MFSNPVWVIGLVAAIGYGLSIGSFLNVVIYRVPMGQSVASPVWSYCPNCKHRLSTADLLPLFSFLALGRKCRYCRQGISWRYFGVELLTGILFTLVYLHDGFQYDAIFDCLFVALLVPIFFIDLEHFFIPDELSVLGFAVGVLHNIYGIWQNEPGQWSRVISPSLHAPGSIVAAVACALIFHMISFVGLLFYGSSAKQPGGKLAKSVLGFWAGVADDYAYLFLKFLGFGLWLPAAKRFIAERQEEMAADEPVASETDGKTREEIREEIENDEEQTGMGQGDAKLALMIGANLSVAGVGLPGGCLSLSLLSFFLAVLAGTVIGVGIMIAQKRSGRTAIPFGPFMVVGALVAFLVGQPLIHWYWSFAFPAK